MCSANLAVAEYPRRGYTLVSSPSRRPILSTFLSILAWHVISLAHSIGNQPRSPSRSLSPSYQPAKKGQRSQGTPSIWRNLDCVWLHGRSVCRGKFQSQHSVPGWVSKMMQGEERGGTEGNLSRGNQWHVMMKCRTWSEALKWAGWESLGAWAELKKGMMMLWVLRK